MVRLNIHEAKTHLSRYLRRIEEGETILLCRHNRPIAEIRPVAKETSRRRAFGLDQGKITIGPAFWEPLDADTVAYFGGEDE